MPVLTREHLIKAFEKTYGTKGMPRITGKYPNQFPLIDAAVHNIREE